MNKLQYNFLTNLETEGTYGEDTLTYLKDAFALTETEARLILLEYMKLPRLGQAGQVTMERYRQVTGFDILAGLIALIGVIWAVTTIL